MLFISWPDFWGYSPCSIASTPSADIDVEIFSSRVFSYMSGLKGSIQGDRAFVGAQLRGEDG